MLRVSPEKAALHLSITTSGAEESGADGRRSHMTSARSQSGCDLVPAVKTDQATSLGKAEVQDKKSVVSIKPTGDTEMSQF